MRVCGVFGIFRKPPPAEQTMYMLVLYQLGVAVSRYMCKLLGPTGVDYTSTGNVEIHICIVCKLCRDFDPVKQVLRNRHALNFGI